MATITMIPATRRVGNRAREEEAPKLRVAAYCRVSTETDEQATSYEAQIEHYTEYIQKNPTWEFAGIYADDGISGTNTKKREEFNRLIEDCMAGQVDMVVTKSISRFARNTLDCLNYIRQLKDQNIPVYFEKEGINTLDAKVAMKSNSPYLGSGKLTREQFLFYEMRTTAKLKMENPDENAILQQIKDENLFQYPTEKMIERMNDDRVMIACCNDGTRPVIFKIERIDCEE